MTTQTLLFSPQRVRLTMLGVALGLALGALDSTVVGTAMPRVIAELHGFQHYAWVFTAYMVTSTVAMPIAGRLSDLYGRKVFYLPAIAVFLIGSSLSGMSQSMTQLIVFRALQGLGAGAMMAIAFTVVADLFPPERRGRVQGLLAGVFGVASVLGPPLGGFLTDNWGWRWVFYLNVPVGLLALTVLLLFFPNVRPEGERPKIDYAGGFALVLWVVPLLLALSWGGSEFDWLSPPIFGLFAWAAAMLGVFVYIERRAAQPILPLAFFANEVYRICAASRFLIGVLLYGSLVYVPLFIQNVIPGATATSSGAAVTPMMLSLVTGSAVAGAIVSRWGRYRFLVLGAMALLVVGMFLLSRLNVTSGSGDVVLAMIVVGVAMGFSLPVYTVVVQSAVPRTLLGAATSSLQFYLAMAGSMGAAVFGTIVTNTYTDVFQRRLPASIHANLTFEQLQLWGHPSALLNAETRAAVQRAFEAVPGGEALYTALVEVMREAVAVGIQQIFLLGLGLAVLTFLINLLLREIPIVKTDEGEHRAPAVTSHHHLWVPWHGHGPGDLTPTPAAQAPVPSPDGVGTGL